ncbi:MAG: MotA/TolQ/ExbB proton channel family protein, partial [Mariprofundaceae bacterium]
MGSDVSVWSLVWGAGPVVLGVILLLLLMSLISWAIIFNKWRLYRRSKLESDAFATSFWSGKDLDTVLAGIPSRYPNSPLPNIFQAGYREFMRYKRDNLQVETGKIIAASGLDGIRRALDAGLSREVERLSRHLAFLATVGSTSPFIGLFGTVWGIMNAFQNIAF